MILSLLFAASLAACTTASALGGQPLPATVRADCAPWDGAAFTVHVPLESGGTLQVSIWHAPDLGRGTTFSLVEAGSQDGAAFLNGADGSSLPLHGSVRFDGVSRGQPVQGSFDLSSSSGRALQGSFLASWEESTALCG